MTTLACARRAVMTAVAFATVAATMPAVTQARTVIASGHIDAVAARLERGRLVSTLKDGTRGGDRVVWRDPNRVTIRLGSRAAFTIPAGMRFLGRRGARAWLIPQAYREGVVWAGWNTEEIPPSAIRGGVRWTLRAVDGPGKVVLFQTGSFGQAQVIFDSGRRLPQAMTIPAGTHAHGNWAFTRRGTYRFTYRLAATKRSGAAVRDDATLRFEVG